MKTATTTVKTGIWIDGSQAVIVTFNGDKKNIITIKSGIDNPVHHKKEGRKGTFMGNHHLNHEKKFEERKKHETDRFLEQVLAKISGAGQLYIFGPAEMKNGLKKKIESTKSIPDDILKAVEPAGDMTLNQIAARVKEFYHIGD